VTADVDEALRGGVGVGDSVTFAFGDASAQLYGLARLGLSPAGDGPRAGSALALLFAGREPVAALARGGLPVDADAGWEALELAGLRATVDEPLARWTVAFEAEDGQGFALEFAALGAAAALPDDAPAARLGGMAGYEQPCRVRGTVRAGGREHAIDGLGQRGHAWGDADWDRIELARTVTAWTETRCAALTAIRPAGAADHATEATWAALWEPEGVLEVEDGRLSTTYDADGHTRRAGLELWAPDAEWPRRAAGEVLCGSSLDLGSLRLDCSFFRWHLEGRAGVGRYDILRRAA
jgi:hypothetical protein